MDDERLAYIMDFLSHFKNVDEAIDRASKLADVEAVIRQLDRIDDVRGVVSNVTQLKQLLQLLRTHRDQTKLNALKRADGELSQLRELLGKLGDLGVLTNQLAALREIEKVLYQQVDIDQQVMALGDTTELYSKLEALAQLKSCIQSIGSALSGN